MDICYSDPKSEEIVGTFDEKKSEKQNKENLEQKKELKEKVMSNGKVMII